MRSGSKRDAPARPPELAAWQLRALDKVAASRVGSEVVFGGGAALAALHLHHRTSEDLDFFLEREVEPAELSQLVKDLKTPATRTEVEVVGPRTSIVLLGRSRPVGRIDFAFFLELVRAKFDAGPHRLGLASRLLLVHQIKELPRMLRPVDRAELVAFFEERARELARTE